MSITAVAAAADCSCRGERRRKMREQRDRGSPLQVKEPVLHRGGDLDIVNCLRRSRSWQIGVLHDVNFQS